MVDSLINLEFKRGFHFSDVNIEARARGRMGQVDFIFLALVLAVFVVVGHS